MPKKPQIANQARPSHLQSLIADLDKRMEMIHDTVNQNNENNVIMLRQAIISELDATSLYEQMAASTSNPKLAKMFLDIAKEEKVHVGEFEAMLNIIDKENEAAVKDGHEEATKKIGSFQSRISSALKNA